MTGEQYNYLRSRFLQREYNTEEHPASIGSIMMDKRLINMFTTTQSQSYSTSVKEYVIWLRKQRAKLFPLTPYSTKRSKFVSVFGVSRRHSLYDLLRMI